MFTIKMQISDKFGTHYGIYHGSLMIHYEFSKNSADRIVRQLLSGHSLHDILLDQISSSLKKEQRKHESLKAEIDGQKIKIKQLEMEVEEYKKLYTASSSDPFFEIENTNTTKNQTSNKIDLAFTGDFSAGRLHRKYKLSPIDSAELAALIAEVKEKNFSFSSDLSNYIINNNLRQKYKNISGIVTMRKNTDEWDFPGGFPKEIYRIICQELNLEDNGTSARAVGFRNYSKT